MFLKLFRRKADFPEADYLSEYRRTGNLTELGERHIDMVFALFFRHLRDEDDTKNAVMQVFEQLIEALKVSEVLNFKSWLHSVTRNYCLMQLRAKRVVVSDEGLFEHEASESYLQNGNHNLKLCIEGRIGAVGFIPVQITVKDSLLAPVLHKADQAALSEVVIK